MKKTKSKEQANVHERTHNLFTLKTLLPSCLNALVSCKRKAFTMAEILLSLAVIGIIAAMTLPTLTANFQDRAFNAKRLALHARLANAFRMMDYNDYMPIGDRNNETFDFKANSNFQKFMDDLSKHLSIKVISDPAMIFSDISSTSLYCGEGYEIDGDISCDLCGIGSSIMEAPIYAFFQTINGESVIITFGNPTQSNKKQPYYSMCFFLFYDLNGAKGPNKLSKDRGIMGAFYPDNMELYAPMLAAITDNIIDEGYEEGNPNTQKYKYPDYRLPSLEELITLIEFDDALNIPNIGNTFCTIDGHAYNWQSITDNETETTPGCINLLVTNDGSAPKNGVITDISSEDSGD